MNFIHPVLLWALPFALMPVIIYYLMRFRSLTVTWGANYILERALNRLRKKLHRDQIILLTIRTLAAALLVVVFARPASSAKTATGNGVQRILLVDGSYSLLAGEPGHTRWDRVKETLQQLTASWPRGETWSLCLLTDKPTWIESAADQIAPTETALPLARGLAAVRERFPQGNYELYIFADDQATAWRDVAGLTGYWINPPVSSRANAGVTSVAFGSDKNLVGHPSRLLVTVRNFSDEPMPAVAVEILVDGVFFSRESVALLPRQERQVAVDVTFDKAGSHAATARLGKDALAYDNALSAGIEIVERLSVLVLRDADKTGKFDSAWEFLQIAGRATDGALVFNLGDGQSLAGADVVYLDGGCTLTPVLATRLREYVTNGGALVLAVDAPLNAPAWMLPAPLGALRREPIGGTTFQALGRAGLPPSPLRAFATEEDGDLATAKFFTWRELGAIPDGTTVLATFADGRPWLVRKRFTPGSISLLTAGLNGAGNNLIVREHFIPLLVRLFADAAAGTIFPRTVAGRETIRLRLNPGERSVTFQPENAAPVVVTPQKQVATVAGGVNRSGLCSFLVVRDDQPTRVWVGVQGERVDSDLSPLTPAAKDQLGLIEVADWPQLDEALQASRRGGDWHHWAMIGLIGLLIGELLMQRRFL
ncbi:MAG: hypothetical protein PCFJNLEI_00460 [Verrucomicrobiae bacterium]|nr:hypothetical protein [Verrucomicrobiae bacterium]